MRKSSLVIVMASLAAARVAAAEGEGKSEVGIGVALLPAGTAHFELGGIKGSGDTATAYAVGALIGFRSSLISVDLAPRFLFNVRGSGSTGDAAKQLDLSARLAVGGQVVPKVSVRGYVAPGYSIVFPSSGDDPKGFIVGFGGMVGYELAPGTEIAVDLGYTLGYQSVTSTSVLGTITATAADDYLHLGVGLVFVR
jgi:opacity protein-like surface antigen